MGALTNIKPMLKKLFFNKKLRYGIKGLKINNKSFSIPAKIISIVSIILILIMTAANAIIYIVSYNKIMNINKDNMKIVSNEIYENFKNLIKIQTNDLDKISMNNDIIQLLAKRNLVSRTDFLTTYSNNLDKLMGKLKQYSNDPNNDEHVFVLDKQGVIIADSSKEFLNSDLSNYDYVSKALEGQRAISDVSISVVSSRPIITFIQPVKDESGSIIGAVGKSVFTDYFAQRFDKFRFLKDGYIFIVNNSQNVIYHPEKYYINKKVDIDEINSITKDKNIFNSKVSNFIQYTKSKKQYISLYITVPELKSIIFLTVDKEDIKNSSNVMGIIIICMTLLMVILIIPICYILIKKVLKPMNILIKNTMEISKGNLKVKNDIKNSDEVGQLANSFTLMTNNIKKLLLEVKDVIEELSATNSIIKEVQEKTTINMAQINESAQSVAVDTDRVEKTVNWSFDCYEKIVEKTQQVTGKSGEMLIKANKIKNINSMGIDNITNLKRVNEESIEKINDVYNSFKELNNNLENVKKVTHIVNNISSQTHMLSLNASIEAARAGNFGHGFKVVAEQIRRLSDSTAEQMQRIDEIIANVYMKMEEMQRNIEMVNSVSLNQFKVVNGTIDNYKEISSSTDDILIHIEDINSNIEMLNRENDNITKSLREVKDMAGNFNNSINEINNAIDIQYIQTKGMDKLVVELEQIIENLNLNMNAFEI